MRKGRRCSPGPRGPVTQGPRSLLLGLCGQTSSWPEEVGRGAGEGPRARRTWRSPSAFPAPRPRHLSWAAADTEGLLPKAVWKYTDVLPRQLITPYVLGAAEGAPEGGVFWGLNGPDERHGAGAPGLRLDQWALHSLGPSQVPFPVGLWEGDLGSDLKHHGASLLKNYPKA